MCSLSPLSVSSLMEVTEFFTRIRRSAQPARNARSARLITGARTVKDRKKCKVGCWKDWTPLSGGHWPLVLPVRYADQHRKFAHRSKWICVPMWNAL